MGDDTTRRIPTSQLGICCVVVADVPWAADVRPSYDGPVATRGTVPNRYSDRGPLDPDVIVAAARTIVDREGLDRLTMRHLGRELGVEAMSIYHHVPNKAALLDLVVADVLAPLHDTAADGSASASIAEFARAVRALLVGRSEFAPILAPSAVLDTQGADRVAARLRNSGFDEDASRWIVEAFVGFAAGHTAFAIEAGTADDDAAFETGLRFMLAGLRQELGE